MKLLLVALLAVLAGAHHPHHHHRRYWRAAGVFDTTACCATGFRTASGVWPSVGMAASDLWPLGTRLRVEGVGVVTITDRTDGLTQLDLFFGRGDCERRALQFGRQQLRVAVAR